MSYFQSFKEKTKNSLAPIAVLLAMMFLVSGCSYMYSATATDFNSSNLKANEGIVFLSLTQEKNRFSGASYSFYFRNDADDGIGKVAFSAALLGLGAVSLEVV